MNEEQLSDLKQFIAATVSQATASMATKDDIANMATKDDIAEVKGDIAQLDSKLTSHIDDLDLKLDTIAETLNEQMNSHEARLTTLEQHAAPA